MNPDDQRTPNPAQSFHPVQPIQPVRSAPAINPADLEAALAEPVAAPIAPAIVVVPVAAPNPVVAAQVTPTPNPVAAAPVVSVPPAASNTVESIPPAVQSTEPVSDDTYDDEQEYDDEPGDEPVSWVAKEYIHQEKGTTWFIIFAIVVVALIAIAIFLMKSWSFAVLLAVIAVGVVVYSRRPPRELNYSLTDEGLTIDQTLHEFEKFKSFGVIHDGEEFSVILIPTRRFQPGTTVYFPEEAGEDIVDMLGSRLPMRDIHLDVVDRLVRLIRL